MLIWLTENLATIVIALALAVIVSLIILHLIRQKRSGKSSCGGNCSSCPMAKICQEVKN